MSEPAPTAGSQSGDGVLAGLADDYLRVRGARDGA